ncbi:36202_t:CDS:1, partial [Gigaspora margarita]
MVSNSFETYDNLINSPAVDNNYFKSQANYAQTFCEEDCPSYLPSGTIIMHNGLIPVLTPTRPNYYETFNSEDPAI